MKPQWLFALVGLCLFASCSFDDRRVHCSEDSDCAGDERTCYQGFCVKKVTSAAQSSVEGRGGDGGRLEGGDKPLDGGLDSSSRSKSPMGGSASARAGDKSGAARDASQSMDAGAVGVDACRDDDTRGCTVAWQDATAVGGCGDGTQRCIRGAWGACMPRRMTIGAESCNQLDDDCDGKVDEDADLECYPSGAKGCAQNADGTFSCKGICQAGVQRCVDGKLNECTGAKLPKPEMCGLDDVDENCNGPANDGCDCRGDVTQACYSGPIGTSGVGTCVAGRQSCVSGKWGTCDGEVTPQSEVCNGKDDDCDGSVDNAMGIGNVCTDSAKKGVCSVGTLQCQTGNNAVQCVATLQPTPETCDGKDDDCNGVIDDVPAMQLQTDAAHCGSCNKACGASGACCGGQCIDIKTDAKNCGMCGKTCAAAQTCTDGMCMSPPPVDAGTVCDAMRPCAAGELCCGGQCVPNDKSNCGMCGVVCKGAAPACCSNTCVDLSEAANCGKCGNACPVLDGGSACMCVTTGTAGVYECRKGTLACQ